MSGMVTVVWHWPFMISLVFLALKTKIDYQYLCRGTRGRGDGGGAEQSVLGDECSACEQPLSTNHHNLRRPQRLPRRVQSHFHDN